MRSSRAAVYGADVINACRVLGVHFSITMRMNASAKATIARIDEDAWTPIKYPQAVWDEEGQCWISDAEIAEIRYIAFTSKPKKQQVTARLIVCRAKRLSAGTVPAGQGTLFDTWCYHAAWLALAALAHNLTRAAGALTSAFHARVTTATIRDRLINVPARLARSARRLTLHLPERWPWSVEELGRSAATPYLNPQLSPGTACTTSKRSTRNQAGGSGLS